LHRWGSCAPSGKLNFHWCVACLPPSLIEYLVVHELVHQVDPQHDERFWSLVELGLPGRHRHRCVLAEAGGQYTGFPTR